MCLFVTNWGASTFFERRQHERKKKKPVWMGKTKTSNLDCGVSKLLGVGNPWHRLWAPFSRNGFFSPLCGYEGYCHIDAVGLCPWHTWFVQGQAPNKTGQIRPCLCNVWMKMKESLKLWVIELCAISGHISFSEENVVSREREKEAATEMWAGKSAGGWQVPFHARALLPPALPIAGCPLCPRFCSECKSPDGLMWFSITWDQMSLKTHAIAHFGTARGQEGSSSKLKGGPLVNSGAPQRWGLACRLQRFLLYKF